MGILDVVSQSLQTHPGCSELHHSGLTLLVKVLETDDDQKVSSSAAVARMNQEDARMVQEEVEQFCRGDATKADLCQIVLNAMMRFEDQVKVQRLGCQVLLSLWQRCDAGHHSAFKLHLQQLGVTMTIDNCLERYSHDDLLVSNGSELNRLLAGQNEK